MTWQMVWMILVIALGISVMVSLTANSIITDLYKERRTMEMGRSNGWKVIKQDD